MKKFLLIGIILFVGRLYGMADPADSVNTYYKNSEYISYCQVKVDAPNKVLDQVVDDFIYQTKYDLDGLFKWGLKGLKLRNEKDNILVFNFLSTNYDAKDSIVMATGNVEVPHIITFPDIHVNSQFKKMAGKNGQTKVDIDVLYSDAFLKKTTGVFRVIPGKDNQNMITLETKVKFGWFFNIFMTKASYTQVMEWRFHKMLENIKVEAEKRASDMALTEDKNSTTPVL